MQITDHTLTVDSTSIELPKLAVASTVHVWQVPAEYRVNGYFVSTQIPGQPQEIPACDSREAVYLGALPLEADAGVALQAAKDAKITAVAQACDAALAPYAVRFGVYERDTWALQLAEAQAILKDASPTTNKYPVIGGIIAHTGESWGDFAQAVISNSESWSKISADAIGQRQKIVAQVEKCGTVADVSAVSTVITVAG